MPDPFLDQILPQLAGGAAHTHALGFVYEGFEGDRVRIRVPWREDLVGDPDTGVLAGGLVTTALDHVGGLAIWLALKTFRPIATLDLRVDYMRASVRGLDLMTEARCYRLTRSVGFVRAWAFEDRIDDPIAAAQSVYMITDETPRSTGEAVGA